MTDRHLECINCGKTWALDARDESLAVPDATGYIPDELGSYRPDPDQIAPFGICPHCSGEDGEEFVYVEPSQWRDGWDTETGWWKNDPTVSLRKFVEQVADLTKDGELVDGVEFDMASDDAVETLHALIRIARTLIGRAEQCGETNTNIDTTYTCTLPAGHDGPHVMTQHPMEPTWPSAGATS
jgi:hypothetical protein